MSVTELVPEIASGALGASAVSWALVRYRQAHLHVTGDRLDGQPQRAHVTPVPRVGGLGVLVGVLLGGAVAWSRHAEVATYSWLLLLASLPAYFGGLAEDTTGSARPLIRLLLTLVTASIAFVWLGARLYRADLWWLDAAFAYWPLSLAGTLFAIAGLAHAMNIIDGCHGLCAGIAVQVLFALALAAGRVDDPELTLAACIGAGAFFGFLLLNYPFGRIFLGDGGAYLAGILIGAIGARLVGQHTAVSPWFPFALVVYPVWETLFSALRRLAVDPGAVGKPDALHLHSLIRRRLRETVLSGNDEISLQLSNALTALPLWAIEAVMAYCALRWYDSTPALITMSLLFIPGYTAVYWGVSRLLRPAPSSDL